MNPTELERVGKEFLKSYKQKTESMIKDIKSNIQSSQKDDQQKQRSKKEQNATKKELTVRLIRILMLHFTTFIEVIKVGQFGN